MILLRSLVFFVFFFAATAVMALSGLIPWALPILFPANWASRLARAWARVMLGGLRVICGTRYEVTGAEHLRDLPVVVASMHQSAFDTMVWMLLLDDPAYVLKIELLRIPVFGMLCRRTGMIAVDRRAGAAAIRALLAGAEGAIAAGRSIVIFPEGTRVAPGVKAPLQPGIAALAIHCRRPVLPVLTDSGHYWGRRSLLRRPGTIRIEIHPALPAGLTRQALMQSLSALYATALDPVENPVGTATETLTRAAN